MSDTPHPDNEAEATLAGFRSPEVPLDADVTQPRRAGSAPEADGSDYPFLSAPGVAGDLGAMERYRVIELLGQGGMGFVFRAVDTQLERTVALKVMKPDLAAQDGARERFLREARAMAAVRSDHVITIHQVGEENGAPFFAMEYLRGQAMDQWLSAGGRPTAGDILRWGLQICEGLGAAHEQGLIHRDIKPANLWLESPRNRIKILDFGLACAVRADSRLTLPGTVIGTPEYMSPEQVDDSGADARTDLFSLGCVLYRLAAGRTPFTGDTTLALIKALATTDPPALNAVNPEIPKPLSQVVTQLLAKRPEDRPNSARETHTLLQSAEAAVPAAALNVQAPAGTGVHEPSVLAPAATGEQALVRTGDSMTLTIPTRGAQLWIVLGLAAAAVLVVAGIVSVVVVMTRPEPPGAPAHPQVPARLQPPPHPADSPVFLDADQGMGPPGSALDADPERPRRRPGMGPAGRGYPPPHLRSGEGPPRQRPPEGEDGFRQPPPRRSDGPPSDPVGP